MNINKTLNLINEYLADIQLFMTYFEKKYNRKDVLRALHDGDISRSGKIANTVEYELHGIGCHVFFPDREIDFDFGPELRTDGFDLWRLKEYLKQRPDIAKDLSSEELVKVFNYLIDNGIISKCYNNSNLYFMKKVK